MRKVKEIFRLHFQAGLSERKIARSCSVSRSTVSDYLGRAAAVGLSWAVMEPLSEAELTAKLFPPAKSKAQARPQPDFAGIHQQLRRKHVTLQLLWQEYRQAFPEGYQYSQFCDLYRRWKKSVDVVLRQSHRAGEKMFVDYAGEKVEVVDRTTGQGHPASIFVAVLGASNYTFAEATGKQDLASWIGSHVRAFEFFGGSTKVIVPDNTRTAVSQPCFYEPELNPSYAEMAAHYQVAVLPTRPAKPRDKAKVEAGVLVVERWILAALRQRRFFNLAELNEAISQLLEQLNTRPFRKLPGSRRELFQRIDRPALGPLPQETYQFAHWKKARVNIDYHVELDRHYYSVPYALVGRSVEIRYSATSVEILHRGERVAFHRRSLVPGGHTTVKAHRPASHQRYLEWSPSRLIGWASKIGPHTAGVVQQILASRRWPEQGYRSVLGLLRLGKTFGEDRLEGACHRALALKAVSYQSVKSILRSGLDRQALPESCSDRPGPQHSNIRGADYFDDQEGNPHVR